MEIISLSLDEETTSKIEKIQQIGSFNGRSELIRKAIENLHKDIKARERLQGPLNAIIVVRHPHTHDQNIAHLSHKHDGVINTQLHSKLDENKCLEVFHTEGLAGDVLELFNKLEGSKHTESVTLLPQI